VSGRTVYNLRARTNSLHLKHGAYFFSLKTILQ
jgi:hypothetical protein